MCNHLIRIAGLANSVGNFHHGNDLSKYFGKKFTTKAMNKWKYTIDLWCTHYHMQIYLYTSIIFYYPLYLFVVCKMYYIWYDYILCLKCLYYFEALYFIHIHDGWKAITTRSVFPSPIPNEAPSFGRIRCQPCRRPCQRFWWEAH